METTIKLTQLEKSVFDFLNALRKSGSTNMFGAGPYVAEEFGISKYQARDILSRWMENFNEDGYDHLI